MISPRLVKIYAVYQFNKTIVGTISINVADAPNTDIIRLNYGMNGKLGKSN